MYGRLSFFSTYHEGNGHEEADVGDDENDEKNGAHGFSSTGVSSLQRAQGNIAPGRAVPGGDQRKETVGKENGSHDSDTVRRRGGDGVKYWANNVGGFGERSTQTLLVPGELLMFEFEAVSESENEAP